MTEISVPKQYQSGYEKLKQLNESSLRTLLEVLEAEQPVLMQRELADHVASKLTDLGPDDVRQIINTVVGLYWGRESLKLSTREFVDALVDQSFDRDDPRAKTLREYLPKLLTADSVIITAKAFDVLTEHQNTIHDLRIITDLRPIFRENLQDGLPAKPTAAVITHTLKVSYHRDREISEFFLALDNQDMDLLRALMERAAAKEESLKALLVAAKIPCIETQAE